MILHIFAAITKCLNMNYWTKTTILLLSLLLTGTVSMAEVSKRYFRNYSAADGLADNSAHTLSCTRTGRMVITTMGQINFYDGQRFSYINTAEENLYPLSNYSGNYHLYFDKYHHLWLKNKHNVTCVNLTTETFVNSIKDEFSKFGMEKPVQDIFVDDDHIVWLLTEDGLYNVESKKTQQIRRDLNLQDLDVYDKDQLMLFYDNGLLEIIDLKTEKKVYEGRAYDEKDVLRYDRSSVLLRDKNVFYQIRNGSKEAVLNLFDITKKEWKEIMRTPYHLNNLAMKEQTDSLLFIPCEYGYWVYETWKNGCRHFDTMIMENGQIVSTNLNVICFDRQGGMWVGTERRGLLYSQPHQPPFSAYTWNDHEALTYFKYVENLPETAKFRGKDVNCYFQDSRGWTWVGTGQGLQLYRKETDVLPQVITKRDGLLNNVIHSVIEDQQHNIWVSTSWGVSCLLFKGDKVHYVNSYNSYDKVPNESFINGKAALLHDGSIVMQSLDHVVVFNPNKMKTLDNHYDFKLYPKLVRLMVNGVNVRTGEELDGNVILEKALTRTKELNLNYDQNSISLTFSASFCWSSSAISLIRSSLVFVSSHICESIVSTLWERITSFCISISRFKESSNCKNWVSYKSRKPLFSGLSCPILLAYSSAPLMPYTTALGTIRPAMLLNLRNILCASDLVSKASSIFTSMYKTLNLWGWTWEARKVCSVSEKGSRQEVAYIIASALTI